MIMVDHSKRGRRAISLMLVVLAFGVGRVPDSQAREVTPAVKAEKSEAEPAKRKRVILKPVRERQLVQPVRPGGDPRASQRGVCQAQCNLERQSCDTRGSGFQDRADQLQAARSSCFLAVQGCLSRC
jgi:hypothetical protein